MIADSSIRPSELIEQARNGSSLAVGRLLELYLHYLKILATTQLDQKLRHRVSPSDIVQETVCEAHRDFHQFRGGSEREFVAWLRKILVNNLARVVERHVLAGKRDVRREFSLQQMQKAMDRSTMQMDALLIAQGDTPSEVALEHERGVYLANCIAQLPEDYRTVVMLRNFQSLPFSEVANRMERTSGAVRMLWLRALEQLKRLLEEGEST
jgi:RNA polymerase sigma-70 factor (ECF subfamily)